MYIGWNWIRELKTFACSGGKGRDYNGHLFWDTEMYILPAMVLTHPDMVKYILRYRSAFAQQAMELAQSMDHEGEFATIVNVRLTRMHSSRMRTDRTLLYGRGSPLDRDFASPLWTESQTGVKTKISPFQLDKSYPATAANQAISLDNRENP